MIDSICKNVGPPYTAEFIVTLPRVLPEAYRTLRDEQVKRDFIRTIDTWIDVFPQDWVKELQKKSFGKIISVFPPTESALGPRRLPVTEEEYQSTGRQAGPLGAAQYYSTHSAASSSYGDYHLHKAAPIQMRYQTSNGQLYDSYVVHRNPPRNPIIKGHGYADLVAHHPHHHTEKTTSPLSYQNNFINMIQSNVIIYLLHDLRSSMIVTPERYDERKVTLLMHQVCNDNIYMRLFYGFFLISHAHFLYLFSLFIISHMNDFFNVIIVDREIYH